MPRSSRKTVELTETLVLTLIERSAAPRRPACLSIRVIAQELGISPERVRNTLRTLIRRNLVTAEPRYADDGGQLANGYRLTRLGRERLHQGSPFGAEVMEVTCDIRSRDPSISAHEPVCSACGQNHV